LLDFILLKEVPINIQRTVKYTQDINDALILDKVGSSVMPVEQNADFTARNCLKFAPNFRLISQQLGFLVN
jgi:hypothetical protein